jgi:hypothetical protein
LFDLDKLLEDVQNGLYPITAYHLLFPTHSSLSLLTKSSFSDKALTTSSSYSSLPSTTITDNDLTTPIQSLTDPLVFYPTNSNDSTGLLTNGIKSRNGITTITTTFERSSSATNDSEHNTNESISTINNNSTMASLSNGDEKENRKIIDIQCKLKTKDTGLCMVKN